MLCELVSLFAIAELPLSSLLAPLNKDFSSGEINGVVENPEESLELIKTSFEGEYEIDHLDGIEVAGPDWWFNVRSFNTEPLLRLNVEANSEEQLLKVSNQVLALIG